MASEPAPSVERRIVTVLFADLVGFTSLSERLDPEDVATLQDAYFAGVRETIGRYGGVLEKFIGDAAMAVFGVPKTRDDDAERAVRAGLALVSAVEQLAARLGLATDGGLRLRVGVNSGEVVHAAAGPDQGRVTGDTVNLAARLQTAAEPNTVLIGELTALAVEESIELQSVGELELKGKADAVRSWHAVGVRPEPSRETVLGRLRSPLLGREVELANLAEAFERVAGKRQAERWVVVAPPGVGKSRLLAEFASVGLARAAVLRARLRPQVVAPYEAIGQLLRDAVAHAGDEPRTALGAALADGSVSPTRQEVVLREAMALIGPAERSQRDASIEDIGGERDARFDAWLDALDTLARDVPSVWLVEDVHWAGPDLLAFLSHATSAPARAGRLVVASARPSVLETAPDWCVETTAPPSVHVLDLRPLAEQNATALVTALVGEGLPSALVKSVAERSDGNPLFIEELLRTWISVGTLAPAGDGWRLAVDPGQVTLPASVQAIYAAQLDDLPADARLVARRASVAGRRFAQAALGPLELADRTAGLETLRRRAFLAGPQPDHVAGEVYAFRHALLRDAGYASLARTERARLHAALARWMAEIAGTRSDEVAESIGNHYAQAHASLPALATEVQRLDRDELARSAADWLERGAEHSLRLAAHQAATELLHRSIALTAADAPLDLARRRMRLGEVSAETADLDAGIAELTSAMVTFDEHLSGDDGGDAAHVGYGRAAHALGAAYMQQIRFDRTEALMGEALAKLGSVENATTARLLGLRAWSVAAQGRSDGPLEDIARAISIEKRIGDPELELDLRDRRATVRDEIDSTDAAEWEAIQRLAVRLGRWRQAVVATRVCATLTADSDPESAGRMLQEAADLAAAHGQTEQLGWTDYARCELDFSTGAWESALVSAERALALSDRYAYTRLAFRTWMVVLPMAAARRDRSLADRWVTWWERSMDSFPPSPSPYGLVLRAVAPLQVAAARGEPLPFPDVEVGTTEQVFSNAHFIAAVETLIAAWLEAGSLDAAATAAANVRRSADDPDAGPLLAASAGLVAAWIALAHDEPSVARDAARDGLANARRIGAAWWIARLIRTLESAGVAEPEALAEAESLEERLGIGPLRSPVRPGSGAAVESP